MEITEKSKADIGEKGGILSLDQLKIKLQTAGIFAYSGWPGYERGKIVIGTLTNDPIIYDEYIKFVVAFVGV